MKNLHSTDGKETSDKAIRHKYRVLSDIEKKAVTDIKAKGVELYNLINFLGTRGIIPDKHLDKALTRCEEAVMWAVKGTTI